MNDFKMSKPQERTPSSRNTLLIILLAVSILSNIFFGYLYTTNKDETATQLQQLRSEIDAKITNAVATKLAELKLLNGASNKIDLPQQQSTQSDIGEDMAKILNKIYAGVIGITGARPENVVGSGFIYSQNGYVVTDYSLIKHIAGESVGDIVRSTLHVVDYNKKVHRATFIGWDTKMDIALLKIEGRNFSALRFADSNKFKVGDKVLAVGNLVTFVRDRTLTYTITQGIISQTDRIISPEYPLMLQTDTPLNPGIFGGPLVNEDGELMGITSLKLVGFATEGVGFAIPSNDIKPVIDNIINHPQIQLEEKNLPANILYGVNP